MSISLDFKSFLENNTEEVFGTEVFETVLIFTMLYFNQNIFICYPLS